MARDAQTAVQLISLLGRLGRPGGAAALALGAIFGGSAWYLLEQRLSSGTREWIFIVPVAFALGGAFGLTGLYVLVTGGGIFKRDERFRTLPPADLLRQFEAQPRPFFICADCRIVLPFEVAVGRCPRCHSSGACLEVASDDDARTARAALGFD